MTDDKVDCKMTSELENNVNAFQDIIKSENDLMEYRYSKKNYLFMI